MEPAALFFLEKYSAHSPPGLSSMETMLMPFETVVDYCHYRLTDTAVFTAVKALHVMHRLNSKIAGIHHTLDTLDGFT